MFKLNSITPLKSFYSWCKNNNVSILTCSNYSYQFKRLISNDVKIDLTLNEKDTVDTLFNGLVQSNRASLAQSITLVESTHPRKRLQAKLLLSKALHHCSRSSGTSNQSLSFRIGKVSY